jgi:hypothetical protein
MRAPHPTLWLAACLAVFATAAVGQSASQEDRLRDALRKTTVDLRAAQDSQVALQASLEQAQKERDALQQQVAQLNAQSAQRQAEPAPAAPAPAAPPQPSAEEQQLRAAVDTLKRQNADLQAGVKKWQAAYQQAASVAQAKDAESRQLAASNRIVGATLGVCEGKNTRLLAVANDILHLYRQQDFKSLLLMSYEPLLGYKKVELENIVQDNEDRVRAQKYYPGEQPQTPAKASAR